MGVLTVQSYFNRQQPEETQIYSLAQSVYDSVEWGFLLDPSSRQFYLSWKPNEPRDETPAYNIPDAARQGSYSGVPGRPATLDYYTDEAFLVTLLALGSVSNPVPAEVHCAWKRARDSAGLVRSYPGALFTYQFLHAFLDTRSLNLRPCPDEAPVDWYENSRKAVQAAINYAESNPSGWRTYGRDAWGISAAEGPDDQYRANGAPPAAVNPSPEEDGTVTYYGMLSAVTLGDDLRARAVRALRVARQRGHWHPRFGLPDAFHDEVSELVIPGRILLQAESAGGKVIDRSEALGLKTVQLDAGQSHTLNFQFPGPPKLPLPSGYRVNVRYSNDNFGPLETVEVRVDGARVGQLAAQDTGDGGRGWNIFEWSGLLGPVTLSPGRHTVTVIVSGGDGFGVEIDAVSLEAVDPVQRSVVRAEGPWLQRALFAIDQGPILLHLENARSGLIWHLLSRNENIQRALQRLAPITTVSAAGFAPGPVAPESIASVFGPALATGTQAADRLPLPLVLAGASARVRDSTGTIRPTALFFVSPPRSTS